MIVTYASIRYRAADQNGVAHAPAPAFAGASLSPRKRGYVFNQVWTRPSPSLCSRKRALRLGLPHACSCPIGWPSPVRVGAGLEGATRPVSLASGGILNPPPRLLVEDNDASHPLRESGGGLGMVFRPAKHVPPQGHKPAARLSSPKSTRRATIRSGFSHKVSRDSLPRAKSRGQLQSDPSTGLGTKIAQKAARTVEVPA
jgi:hypothetical protein